MTTETETTLNPLRVERMGLVPYEPMHQLQNARHRQVVSGDVPDTLFLLEHTPVITLGRNSGDGHILAQEDHLQRQGVDVVATGRGGDVTYHGPGQLVAYPVLLLRQGERDIRRYVWRLEEIVLRTAADFGVKAHRVDGLRGLWVGNNKLAAIGVRVARWGTLHGLALNVTTDLRHFALIVPCGLHGRGVVSLADLCQPCPSMDMVMSCLTRHAAEVLERRAYPATPTLLPESSDRPVPTTVGDLS